MKRLLNKIPKYGIQGRLNLLFILLSTIPLLFIAIYVIITLIEVRKDDALSKVKNEVNIIQEKTSLFLTGVEHEILMLSKTNNTIKFIDNIKNSQDNGFKDELELENEFISLLKNNNIYFKQVQILDNIGKVKASIIVEKGNSLALKKEEFPKKPLYFYKYLVKNMKEGEIKLSPSELKNHNTNIIKPSIDCVLPIFKNNELVAILVASIDTDKFFDIFKLHSSEKKVKIVMVNGEGYYFYHSDKKKDWNKLIASNQEKNLFSDYNKNVADSILKGHTGTISDDSEYIIHYSAISSIEESKSNRYIIFTEIPKEIVFAEVYHFRNIFVLIFCIVAVASILAGFYTSRHFIKPINNLVQGTKIIIGGNMNYKIDLETGDELQELVVGFNQLVDYWKEAEELKEKQRLEIDLRERKKYLDNIMDSSLDILITVAKNNKLSYANKRIEDILGYNSQNLEGKYFLDLFPISISDQMRSKWEEVLQDNNIICDTKLIKSDGTEIECLMTISKLQGLNEHLVVIKDITERKHAEQAIIFAKERAEEANKLKTSIIGNLGHEFRTPMIGIMGFSNILTKQVDISEVKEIAELIIESSSRLMKTLNLIMDISKIEAGEYNLDLRVLDLLELVSYTIMNSKKEANEKDLEIAVRTKKTDIYIKSDMNALTSILNNLLENSIKFTEIGKIEVVIDLIDNGVEYFAQIEVIDTGIGIKEEYLDTIFEAFRQGSEGLSRVHEGSGLGLTLVDKYMQILNGKIRVSSEINKGTVFTISIPISDVSINI